MAFPDDMGSIGASATGLRCLATSCHLPGKGPPGSVTGMKILDPDDPFFRPAWRRWVTVLAPGLWGVVEVFTGNPGWAILFLAAAAYAFWMLFLVGPKQ